MTTALILNRKQKLKTNFNAFIGAGSGIGAATALQFAKNGANLSLNDLNEEGLTATIQDCQNAAPTIKV